MEKNVYTRLFSVKAYSITPSVLKLAVTSSMPDLKLSNFPLRSVKKVMKQFTPQLEPELQETRTKSSILRYTQTVYDHIKMF